VDHEARKDHVMACGQHIVLRKNEVFVSGMRNNKNIGLMHGNAYDDEV